MMRISGEYSDAHKPLFSCELRVTNLPEYQMTFSLNIAVIKVGLNEFATLLSDGSQKSQIEHYITEI